MQTFITRVLAGAAVVLAIVMIGTFLVLPGGGCATRVHERLVTADGDVIERDGPLIDEPPLIDACRFCDVKKVQQLVERGADVNARGENGTTCLHEVVRSSWPQDKHEA